MRHIVLALALVFGLGNALESPLDSEIQGLVDRGEDARAFEVAQKGAETGDPLAHEWVGWFYEQGAGVAPDLDRAIHHYRIAIAGGRNYSRWRIGVLIDEGKAEGSLEEAVELFELAAADNFTNAIVSLAVMQATGRGTEEDFEASFDNYLRAAQLGNMHGVYGIGVLFAFGQGVPEDVHEAAAWFLVAAIAGNEDGNANFTHFTDGMENSDIEAIIERAENIAADLGIEMNLVFDPDAPPPPGAAKSKN